MSIIIKIDDTPRATAWNIYNNIKVGECVIINGWATNESTQALAPLGEVVWDCIYEFDESDNMRKGVGKNMRKRIFKYEKDGIGGPWAQKIFKKNKVISDNVPRVTIYRVQ